MSPPDGVMGENLQKNCEGLLCLIVDERSMVGSNTLGWMEYMIRHGVKNASEPWGGIPAIIFLGDDCQLPPVCDRAVYVSDQKSPAGIHGSVIWKCFDQAVSLNTIVRQDESQQKLKQVLLSLRSYKLSMEDAVWLQQFQWDTIKTAYGASVMTDISDNGLFVFPTHTAEWEHNKTQLLRANQHAPIAKCTAVNTGVHSKVSSDKAGGLLQTLYLCNGAKVMLTGSINVEHGLFNGSVGVIIDILYFCARNPTNSLPDVVMVEFSKYTGPPFVSFDPKLVPLVPVERKTDCRCHGCKRKQIPLRLAWGTTIHRCQGMTIGKGESNKYIVIDPGSTQFESRNPGALFVALSRAKSAGGPNFLPDFVWHPSVLVNPDRLCHVVRTMTTNARSAEIFRISQLAQCTKVSFSHLRADEAFKNIVEKIPQGCNNEE